MVFENNYIQEDNYIDIGYLNLLEDTTVKEIINTLEETDNHFMLTDDIDSIIKNKIIRQLSLNHPEVFKVLLLNTRESFDIRMFNIKKSEKYKFYCFLEEVGRATDKVYALIVTDKYNNIKGNIMIKLGKIK